MKHANRSNNLKKIGAMMVLILFVVISVTGATYAYFAVGATNNNTITGDAATIDLQLDVSRITPVSSNVNSLVPQLSVNTTTKTNVLSTAINSGCVDANNNVVCHVYKITVKNTSTVTLRLTESLILSGGTFNNLKWYTLATANNVTSVPASPSYTYPSSFNDKYGNLKSVTALGDSQILEINKYRYFYVAVWIEEIGENQGAAAGATKKDQGTYVGTVTVDAVDVNGNIIEGITSTFTS